MQNLIVDMLGVLRSFDIAIDCFGTEIFKKISCSTFAQLYMTFMYQNIDLSVEYLQRPVYIRDTPVEH